jgi:membrane-associated phospholipid phosphatase
MFYNSINAQDFKYFNKCAISNSSNQSFSLIKSNNPIDDHSPYELDRNREILLLGSGGILGITGLALINNIQPLTLEEIYQLDPADVNKFDRHAIGPYRTYKAGDFLLYGSLLLPLTFLSNKEMKRDIKILGIIGLEVLLFQAGLNAVVKGISQRIRPYVYDSESGMDKKTSKEAKLSFYSGHTSTTAAMCFYTAKVFSDYLPDGPTKTLIWTGAIIYPALAGYLRVASANHFPTDVIVGYTVGALIGYYIPQLHKRDEEDGLSVFPSFKYNHLSLSAIYSFEFD